MTTCNWPKNRCKRISSVGYRMRLS